MFTMFPTFITQILLTSFTGHNMLPQENNLVFTVWGTMAVYGNNKMKHMNTDLVLLWLF